jgi:hypothetical protein
MDLINLMIKQGATDWDWGLGGACEGGHMDVVNLMIKQGATDWNWGLDGACRGEHKHLAIYMLEMERKYNQINSIENINMFNKHFKHTDGFYTKQL